jgi:hypothetical protein
VKKRITDSLQLVAEAAKPQPVLIALARQTPNTPHFSVNLAAKTTTPPQGKDRLEDRATGFYQETCGFVLPGGWPVTCPESSICSTSWEANVQGCCNTVSASCIIPTACVALGNHSTCTACFETLTCSSSSYPYCAEILYKQNSLVTLTEHLGAESSFTTWATGPLLPTRTTTRASSAPRSSSPPPIFGTTAHVAPTRTATSGSNEIIPTGTGTAARLIQRY